MKKTKSTKNNSGAPASITTAAAATGAPSPAATSAQGSNPTVQAAPTGLPTGVSPAQVQLLQQRMQLLQKLQQVQKPTAQQTQALQQLQQQIQQQREVMRQASSSTKQMPPQQQQQQQQQSPASAQQPQQHPPPQKLTPEQVQQVQLYQQRVQMMQKLQPQTKVMNPQQLQAFQRLQAQVNEQRQQLQPLLALQSQSLSSAAPAQTNAPAASQSSVAPAVAPATAAAPAPPPGVAPEKLQQLQQRMQLLQKLQQLPKLNPQQAQAQALLQQQIQQLRLDIQKGMADAKQAAEDARSATAQQPPTEVPKAQPDVAATQDIGASGAAGKLPPLPLSSPPVPANESASPPSSRQPPQTTFAPLQAALHRPQHAPSEAVTQRLMSLGFDRNSAATSGTAASLSVDSQPSLSASSVPRATLRQGRDRSLSVVAKQAPPSAADQPPVVQDADEQQRPEVTEPVVADVEEDDTSLQVFSISCAHKGSQTVSKYRVSLHYYVGEIDVVSEEQQSSTKETQTAEARDKKTTLRVVFCIAENPFAHSATGATGGKKASIDALRLEAWKTLASLNRVHVICSLRELRGMFDCFLCDEDDSDDDADDRGEDDDSDGDDAGGLCAKVPRSEIVSDLKDATSGDFGALLPIFDQSDVYEEEVQEEEVAGLRHFENCAKCWDREERVWCPVVRLRRAQLSPSLLPSSFISDADHAAMPEGHQLVHAFAIVPLLEPLQEDIVYVSRLPVMSVLNDAFVAKRQQLVDDHERGPLRRWREESKMLKTELQWADETYADVTREYRQRLDALQKIMEALHMDLQTLQSATSSVPRTGAQADLFPSPVRKFQWHGVQHLEKYVPQDASAFRSLGGGEQRRGAGLVSGRRPDGDALAGVQLRDSDDVASSSIVGVRPKK